MNCYNQAKELNPTPRPSILHGRYVSTVSVTQLDTLYLTVSVGFLSPHNNSSSHQTQQLSLAQRPGALIAIRLVGRGITIRVALPALNIRCPPRILQRALRRIWRRGRGWGWRRAALSFVAKYHVPGSDARGKPRHGNDVAAVTMTWRRLRRSLYLALYLLCICKSAGYTVSECICYPCPLYLPCRVLLLLLHGRRHRRTRSTPSSAVMIVASHSSVPRGPRHVASPLPGDATCVHSWTRAIASGNYG